MPPEFIKLTCDTSGEPLLVRVSTILVVRRHPDAARTREVERDINSATFAMSFRPYTEIILDVAHGRIDVRETVDEIMALIGVIEPLSHDDPAVRLRMRIAAAASRGVDVWLDAPMVEAAAKILC